MQKNYPTPYHEVNLVLNEVLTNVQSVLGDNFIGMYLYGSLANGGFDHDSDVDYIVVTNNEIADDVFLVLDTMHKGIATMDSWCATQIEGSYIPRCALQQYNPVNAIHVHIDRGGNEHLHRIENDNALSSKAWWGRWIFLRENVRERGITLVGPSPKTLIEPVSPDELRKAALAFLGSWAKNFINHPEEITHRGYQSYVVLTLCRIHYTLEHGSSTSKQVAAKWAQVTFSPDFNSLIERAWIGRHNPSWKTEAEEIQETLNFIQYALEKSSSFSAQKNYPTAYSEVNNIVDHLLADAKGLLGEQFVGLYLHGSLITGDFDLRSSDIDFLCVTADKLSEETIPALKKMYFALKEVDSKWWFQLEGSFTPQADMHRYNPENGPYPTVHEGKFYFAGHESHWVIQRHLLLKNAVIVEGAEPKTFIAPVSVADLHGALRSFLDEWWIPMLENHVKLDAQDYQAYAILTMCRMLYTFENNEIASKPLSAHWVQEKFGEWRDLIDWALAWKEDGAFDDKKNETMALMQFTVDFRKRENV